jgi:hypothetical protein
MFTGLFWGYIESYLFWFLEELGGSKGLMGLTVTVSCLSGIPFLVLSDVIFRKLGNPNVQILGFIVYAVRLLGYSYIQDPYMCLIYEAMKGVTTSLMFASKVDYSAELGTIATMGTIQGLMRTLYYVVGRGIGSLIGGYLMKWLGSGSQDKTTGTRVTLRVFAVAAIVTALLYFLFNIFYIRRRRNSQKKEENKNEDGKKSPPPIIDVALSNPTFVQDEHDPNLDRLI